MAVAVNSETGYERQNLPEPTDCLWILQPSHVTRSHKNANVKRYAVTTLQRTDGVIAHKWHTTRTGKPGRSVFSSLPPPPSLTRMRTRKNYGWLARLDGTHTVLGSSPFHGAMRYPPSATLLPQIPNFYGDQKDRETFQDWVEHFEAV